MPRPKKDRTPRKSKAAPSDRQLLEGIRRSSEEDFNLLYERYFQRLYSYAYMRLHNRADAEEVVQETFTAVFRSIDAYRGQSSLLSWIYGIAKNTVNNSIRRQKAHAMRLERAELELRRPPSSLNVCTPEEQLEIQRCADAIEQRLRSVPEWHAEVFVMRHVHNLPIREIARRTARSNDAIRSSLYRVKRLVCEAADANQSSVA